MTCLLHLGDITNLLHIAALCSTLQQIATHFKTMQHIAAHCNTHDVPPSSGRHCPSAACCSTLKRTATHCNRLQHTATHATDCNTTRCNTVQHSAKRCNTLQHAATHDVPASSERHYLCAAHCDTLQHTATHCNTLQHTATHYNTLPSSSTLGLLASILRTCGGTRVQGHVQIVFFFPLFLRINILGLAQGGPLSCLATGWRRLIGSPKLQIIFHKRANKYRSLLRKMTYKDKGSYESSPPCTILHLVL